jgi:hypothetical protein
MRRLVLLSALLMAIAISGGRPTTVHGQQLKTATDGPHTTPKTGSNCTSNTCTNQGGCATCVTLTVYMPLTAQVAANGIHCWTNAGGKEGDLPHGQFAELACGKDGGWSIFDPPVTTTTAGNTIVTTTYHNRSSDRDRDVKLIVNYQ